AHTSKADSSGVRITIVLPSCVRVVDPVPGISWASPQVPTTSAGGSSTVGSVSSLQTGALAASTMLQAVSSPVKSVPSQASRSSPTSRRGQHSASSAQLLLLTSPSPSPLTSPSPSPSPPTSPSPFPLRSPSPSPSPPPPFEFESLEPQAQK